MTQQEALTQALHEWECQGQPCTIMGSHQWRAAAILDAGFGVYIEEQRTQAATEERERLRAEVEALPKWDKRSVPGGFHVNRAAVLALLADPEDTP